MSVKTHNYMTNDGVKQFVYHSDYAALLSRHNALREAVKKMRELEESVPSDIDELIRGDYTISKIAARAEVDRLLGDK